MKITVRQPLYAVLLIRIAAKRNRNTDLDMEVTSNELQVLQVSTRK